MNELLLLVTAVISAAFVVGGWRLGKERLYSVMIVLLILVTTVGGKIVLFFGHETNTGNIFYASVYLATYFLIERFGWKEGVYSIVVGVIAVLFFSAFIRLTILLSGAPETSALSNALTVAFSSVPRVALASLCAYALSQSLNVYVYLSLKKRFAGKYLWLRANFCNIFAQLLDSLVFFTIAFSGTVSSAGISEILLTGLVIKIIYMMLASPLLYLNRFEEERALDGTLAVTPALR